MIQFVQNLYRGRDRTLFNIIQDRSVLFILTYFRLNYKSILDCKYAVCMIFHFI